MRIFDPCREGNCADCVGEVAQPSERVSNEGAIEVRHCTHECHEAERAVVYGGEAGC
jgi:hypothetical protein